MRDNSNKICFSFRATICDLCTKWGICKPVPPSTADNGPEILNDVTNGNTLAAYPSPANISPVIDDITCMEQDRSEASYIHPKPSSSQKINRWFKASKLVNLFSKSPLSSSGIENPENRVNRQIYALNDRTFASSLNELAAENENNMDECTSAIGIDNGITSEQRESFPLSLSRKATSLNDLKHETFEISSARK